MYVYAGQESNFLLTFTSQNGSSEGMNSWPDAQ